MIKTIVKDYNELTTDELYRIMQLRIQGFIVDNQVCYQDMEAYYDKNSWWILNYAIVSGEIVGVNSLCRNKTLYGDDGTEYNYPCFRRQAWLREYKGGCSTRDLLSGEKFLTNLYGKANMMLEITYEGGKQPFLDFGCREVGTNIDAAGRKNWVFVYESTRSHQH